MCERERSARAPVHQHSFEIGTVHTVISGIGGGGVGGGLTFLENAVNSSKNNTNELNALIIYQEKHSERHRFITLELKKKKKTTPKRKCSFITTEVPTPSLMYGDIFQPGKNDGCKECIEKVVATIKALQEAHRSDGVFISINVTS